MKAFLFPHAFLLPYQTYTAALHQAPDVARAAARRWLEALSNPEQLCFAEHKIVGLLVERFPDECASHPLWGVLANIARQAQLRAHAATAVLGQLLSYPGWSGLQWLALGETHERFAFSRRQNTHLETLDLAVSQLDLIQVLPLMAEAGFTVQSGPRRLYGRAALAVTLKADRFNVPIRLFGLATQPRLSATARHCPGLSLMEAGTYAEFMGSRRASLPLRRDQLLFDLYQLCAHDEQLARQILACAANRFQKKAIQILGFGR